MQRFTDMKVLKKYFQNILTGCCRCSLVVGCSFIGRCRISEPVGEVEEPGTPPPFVTIEFPIDKLGDT